MRERIKMSSPLTGGSIATVFLGAASAIASAVNSMPLKVIIEPSVLKVMSLIGAPSLPMKTYHDIVMEKEIGAFKLLEGGIVSAYLRKNIITLVERPKREQFEKRLSSLPLNKEEILTMSLALNSSYDRLFLFRSKAREVARSLGLEPSPPSTILVDSLRRGIIGPNKFSNLSSKLLVLEG